MERNYTGFEWSSGARMIGALGFVIVREESAMRFVKELWESDCTRNRIIAPLREH